ncbi:MAG: hypothetical protein HQK96_19045 [Nitrospirae bacterium]|nr:hypothetical protein [Nitrospirota bacterium]
MVDNSTDLNLFELLGASEESSEQVLTLYIPNKNKNGEEIRNMNRWIRDAQKVLTSIGGGSTSMPPADGTWLNPESKDIIREKTTMMYTFIDPESFEENIGLLREYLHTFGRETDQGEVVFEFDGKFYRIRKYDQ